MAVNKQTRSPLTTGGSPADILEVTANGASFAAVPITHPKELQALTPSGKGGVVLNLGIEPTDDSVLVVDGTTGGVRLNVA